MKHDSAQVATASLVEKQSQDHAAMKGDRKTLHILQAGAGIDKENLVGGGRPSALQSSSKEGLKLHKETVEDRNLLNETVHKKVPVNARKKQKTRGSSKDKVKVTVEDLTTQESPSENYWCLLAEKRRLALEEALEENMKLHEKISLLEKEVETQKIMLNETNSVIEVLKEMVADVSDGSIVSSASDESMIYNNGENDDVTDDLDFASEDTDFKSYDSEEDLI